MDSINELVDYKILEIEVDEIDEDTNMIKKVLKKISYNGVENVGFTTTITYKEKEYVGILTSQNDLSFNKHVKVKINNVPASKSVYGVFVGWDNDNNNDGGSYNNMYVGAVGNFVIRMANGQTPQIGDLVESDGNGCGVVQDDDIVRTKTVAKVTSTIPQVIYEDGSFLVTCVLYCG